MPFFCVRALSTWFELVQASQTMRQWTWQFRLTPFGSSTLYIQLSSWLLTSVSPPLSLSRSLPLSLSPSPHIYICTCATIIHSMVSSSSSIHPLIRIQSYIHFFRTHKYTIIHSKKNQCNLCHIWIHLAVITVNMCWSTGIIHTIVYMHVDGYDIGLAEIGDYISCGGWLSNCHQIPTILGLGDYPHFWTNPRRFCIRYIPMKPNDKLLKTLHQGYPFTRPVLTYIFVEFSNFPAIELSIPSRNGMGRWPSRQLRWRWRLVRTWDLWCCRWAVILDWVRLEWVNLMDVNWLIGLW